MFMIQKGMSIKRKRLMILIPDMMERGKYYGSGNTKQDDVVSVVSSVKSSLRGGGGGSTNGSDDEFPVDKAAEEFIQRFYRELLLQKLNLARETTATVRFG
uniref:Uncharacterized protein n=1 Tax=Cannabis sativa TaxID=3483 RepID=A0A803NIG7_CANSA